MKKLQQLLLLAVCLLTTNLSFAQWEKKEYIDEFGDGTGEFYETFTAIGTFSNSATVNSEASYKFVKDESSLILKIFEYGSRPATSIESTSEIVKIKTPSGNVVEIKGVLFSKSGLLFFSADAFTTVVETMKEVGKHTMIFDKSGKYSKSSYKLKFEITE
jgi:hypothetical protein